MLRIVPIVVLALITLAIPSRATDISVTGGIVRGEDLADGSMVFRGIPYAAPPVGDLRWKPPQPITPWSGVRDATKAAAPCAQHNEGWNASDAAAGKEDCLYLSIHAPKSAAGKKYPVFFWIHGGSNRAGSGYGNANSAIYRRGVVLVAIEYRLDVFGFLSSPELTAESPNHTSGNYAALDMIAALQWVRANIARFGGDPDNVTIGGQSAGSHDVGTLLVSPLARGLFHKAIMESGPASLSLPPRTLAENEKIGADLAEFMGLHDLKALRAASATDLLAAGEKLEPPSHLPPAVIWGQQIIDGAVLPRAPLEILAKGEQAHVPLIIGDVTREFAFDAPPDVILQTFSTFFGDKAEQAKALYGVHGNELPPDDPVLGSIGTQMLADVIMRCPANKLASFQIAAGQQVWRYQFGLPRAGQPGPPAHNAELPYVFDAPPPGATFANWPPVQQYWANFFRSGDPNGAGLPRWPSMDGNKVYMAFTPQGPVIGKDLRGPICRLLNGGP